MHACSVCHVHSRWSVNDSGDGDGKGDDNFSIAKSTHFLAQVVKWSCLNQDD